MEKVDVWCFTSAFSVLIIWMLGMFHCFCLKLMVQVSGHGCCIIVEVVLGKKCLAWKVGCLGKGTEGEPFSWLLLYWAAFDTTVINKCAFLGGYISVLENNNKDTGKKKTKTKLPLRKFVDGGGRQKLRIVLGFLLWVQKSSLLASPLMLCSYIVRHVSLHWVHNPLISTSAICLSVMSINEWWQSMWDIKLEALGQMTIS